MDQFDKAATVIVHHQPRQRSFAGAGRFLTEIIAHIMEMCPIRNTYLWKRFFNAIAPGVSLAYFTQT